MGRGSVTQIKVDEKLRRLNYFYLMNGIIKCFMRCIHTLTYLSVQYPGPLEDNHKKHASSVAK